MLVFSVQIKSEEGVYEMNGAELSMAQWPREEQSPVGSVKPQFRRFLSTLLPASLPPGRVPLIALIVYVFSALGVAAVVLVGAEHLINFAWWAIMLIVILAFISISALLVMLVHVQNTTFDTFKVSL